MGTITYARFGARWAVPVRLVCENDTREIVGPAAALRYMEHHFHRRSGELYWRARDLCRGALVGATPSEIARPHFVAACVADRITSLPL